MKIRATLDINISMGAVDTKGTGFQGYLPDGTRYEDVVRVFGKPQFGKSQDGKIKAEWIGKINGLVFTIYDYKSKFDPEQNTDWHIGGKLKLTSELINIYFKALAKK